MRKNEKEKKKRKCTADWNSEGKRATGSTIRPINP
jgi:hypothetical protein